MKIGFIYITRNNANGMRYLGRCRYSRRRWRDYLGSGAALKEAVVQFGPSAFSREIIAEAETLDDLEAIERALIIEYDAINDPAWYNRRLSTHSTKGFTGRTHSQARNTKVAHQLRGRTRPARVVEACRAAMTGRRRSIESIQKQSRTMSGSNHHRAQSVQIGGVIFDTLTEAVQVTGLSYHHVRKASLQQRGTDDHQP